MYFFYTPPEPSLPFPPFNSLVLTNMQAQHTKTRATTPYNPLFYTHTPLSPPLQITTNETLLAKETIANCSAWLEEQIKAQKAKAAHESPAFTKAMVDFRVSQLKVGVVLCALCAV